MTHNDPGPADEVNPSICTECGEHANEHGGICGHEFTNRVSKLPANIAVAKEDILDDGFGNTWIKCGPRCAMEIVRPGKVQCGRCDSPDISTPQDSSEQDAPKCKTCGVLLTLVGHGIGYECLNSACTGCGGTRAIGVKTDETIPCPITGKQVDVTELRDCPGCPDCAPPSAPQPEVRRWFAEELFSLEGSSTHPEHERAEVVRSADCAAVESELSAVLLANKMLVERDAAQSRLVDALRAENVRLQANYQIAHEAAGLAGDYQRALTRVESQLSEAQRDAARYRWLRQGHGSSIPDPGRFWGSVR